LKGVGQTDDTEPAAKTIEHRSIRRSHLKCVGLTNDASPVKPTKSKPNVGAVVQRDNKMSQLNTGLSDEIKTPSSVQLSRGMTKPELMNAG